MQVLRVPYDKLVINYVKRLLPRPFLCTMGESIDMLKGRDKEEAEEKKWERERDKLEADNKKEAVKAIKKATKKKKKADATAAEGSGSVAAVARARAAAAATASASVATEAEKSSVPSSSSAE